MESYRNYNSNNSTNSNIDGVVSSARREDDVESNMSDDDPILTATITFDVTVDPNGQVISATEGQIISESYQTPRDNLSLSLVEHQNLLNQQNHLRQQHENSNSSDLQQDSLTSLQSNQNRNDDNHQVAILHDSLDDNESDDASESTSTESLIERSKKYMSQEAGIIILKRDNSAHNKNFNINLDFDLKNQHKVDSSSSQSGQDLNINVDVDLNDHRLNRSTSSANSANENGAPESQKSFNINFDFDINNTDPKKTQRKTGVDIDLLITADDNKSEQFDETIETSNQQDHHDEEHHYIEHHDRTKSSENDYYTGYENQSLSDKDRMNHDHSNLSNTLRDDTARSEFLHRLTEKASELTTVTEKNSFYDKQIPKAEKFTLEDCIEKILGDQQNSNPVLRPFETVDFEALMKSFEPEEVKEGKLVFYITEGQLLQLLKQRAIIVPNKQNVLGSHDFNKNSLSLVDEKISDRLSSSDSRKTPIKEVELIVDQDNYRSVQSVSSIREGSNSRTQSNVNEKSKSQSNSTHENNKYNNNQYNTHSGSKNGLGPHQETYSHRPHGGHGAHDSHGQSGSGLHGSQSIHSSHEDFSVHGSHAQQGSHGSQKGLSSHGNQYGQYGNDSQGSHRGSGGHDDHYGQSFGNGPQGSQKGLSTHSDHYGQSYANGSPHRPQAYGQSGQSSSNSFGHPAGEQLHSSSSYHPYGQHNIDNSQNQRATGSDYNSYPNFNNNLGEHKTISLTSGTNSIRTAYSGMSEIAPHVGQVKNGDLVNYKDFDILVPRDKPCSPNDTKQPHVDYIAFTERNPSENNKNAQLPKGYGFLNNGLDYSNHKNSDALSELEKLSQRLSNHFDKNTNQVDWPSMKRLYDSPEEQQNVDLMKKFVNGLIDGRGKKLERQDTLQPVDEFIDRVLNGSTKSSSEKENLKLLNDFINNTLKNGDKENDRYKQTVSDKEALTIIDDLINKLKNSITNTNPAKKSDLVKHTVLDCDGHKIIIKTTKRLPSKVYTTDCESRKLVKKKIIYSYLDDAYDSSTKVYEAAINYNDSIEQSNMTHVIDLFDSKANLNYSVKAYDASAFSETICKPSVEHLNKCTSIINTGLKNSNLVQIHPLLNSNTKVEKTNGQVKQHFQKTIEPVMIDSANYEKYVQDISKHFGGLQVTDFPLYVQGLEFKENNGSSYVAGQSKRKESNGINCNETVAKQVASNVDNIQYVKVNSVSNSQISSRLVK